MNQPEINEPQTLLPASSMEEALRRHGMAHNVYHDQQTGRICVAQAAALAAAIPKHPGLRDPEIARNLKALARTTPARAWSPGLRAEEQAARKAANSDQERDLLTVELVNNEITQRQALAWVRRADETRQRERDAETGWKGAQEADSERRETK